MILGATIRLKDEFSTTMTSAFKKSQTLTSQLKVLGHTTVKPVVKLVDTASSSISKIKNSLFSLKGIATMALAGLGIDKLKDETVGAAMSWETQAISMEHWLKGNKELAKEATSWVDAFANATPFESADIFPAMTRGIGISDGDIKTAEMLVTLSADMAALTPGKTIQDAMEALADAKNGEFERLKEFNMKMTQEDMKQLGGFQGFMAKAQSIFAGGADELSKTAKGKFSTITDNIKSLFRSSGMGILEVMKPRLDKITTWFDSNKDTVARWKQNLVTFGRQAADSLFSSLENTFKFINERYINNPEFQQLSFYGKLEFISGDISASFNNWWTNEGGADKAKAFGGVIATALGQGVLEVAPTLGKMAAEGTITAFTAALNSTPLGAAAAGAITGAGIGSVIPGAGTAVGGAAGAVSGAAVWGIGALKNKLFGKSHASGLSYVPYDNYKANLHRGEKVLPRAEADQYRKGNGSRPPVIIQNVNITGISKTTKQIFDEILDIAYAAQINTGEA